ncbi:hypothetical protein FBU59_004865, partial [Linderina macrospora]
PSSETGGARIGESSSMGQKRPVTLVATENTVEQATPVFAAAQSTERPHSAEPQLSAQQQQQLQHVGSPNMFSQRMQSTQSYMAGVTPQSATGGQVAMQYGPVNRPYMQQQQQQLQQQAVFGSPTLSQQYVPVGMSAASTTSTVFAGHSPVVASASSAQPVQAMGAVPPPLVNLAGMQPHQQPPQPIPQHLNMPAPDPAYKPFSASYGALPSRSEASPNSPARPVLPPKPAEWQPGVTSQPTSTDEGNSANRISNPPAPSGQQPPVMPPRRPQQDPQAPALPPKPFPSFSEYDFAPDVPDQPAAASSSGQGGGHVEQLRTLMNMGFSEPQAIQALEMYDYDVNKASNYLIDNAF